MSGRLRDRRLRWVSRRGQPGVVLGVIAAAAVAGASAFTILSLQAYSDGRQSARQSLQVLRTETTVLSQMEWQAVAERGVSDALSKRIEEARAGTHMALEQATANIGSSEGLSAVESELARYLSATAIEFALLAGGDLEAADRVDEDRVDPTFERLGSLVAAAQATAGIHARRAAATARAGTILVLFLSLIAIGALFWRLTSAKRAAREAFFDPLTGLANRMLLTDRLTQALRLAERTNDRVAVLFFDLDDFKRINDTLGHAAGDVLLKAVAERLLAASRASDSVGRLGGDEFVIVLPAEVDATGGTAAAAQRVVDLLSEPFAIAGRQVTVTASIGCAVSDRNTPSADELLRNADLALYAGKRRGKGRVVMYEPSMYETLCDRLQLETDLRGALARNELTVAYQPIVEVGTGRLRSLEALARWTHPVRGNVGPALFIPLAEEIGMIQEIGRFVLLEATQQLRRWQTGHTTSPPIGVFVNVSPVQLQSGRIVEDVREALCESGIDPSTLTLEVTESVLADRGALFAGALDELVKLGIRLAIDDFGKGQSSLASLSQFPLDTLKIDKSFVDNLTDDNGGSEVVRAILELGRALGLDAVAEGIETRGQAEILRALDCDYAQGFHFAYPLPAHAVGDYLRGQADASEPRPRRDREIHASPPAQSIQPNPA